MIFAPCSSVLVPPADDLVSPENQFALRRDPALALGLDVVVMAAEIGRDPRGTYAEGNDLLDGGNDGLLGGVGWAGIFRLDFVGVFCARDFSLFSPLLTTTVRSLCTI